MEMIQINISRERGERGECHAHAASTEALLRPTRPEGLPDDGPEGPSAEDPEGPPRADRERSAVGPGTRGASSSSTSLLAQLGGPPSVQGRGASDWTGLPGGGPVAP
eukprot:4269243-Prorocentrum_lima.AAC.1